MPETPPSPRGRPRLLLIVSGAVVLGIVLLALLALPLLSVKGDSEAARADLTAALDALESDDLATAQEHIASARDHADAASADVNGIGADVWSAIPFLGTPVDDARHLVAALDGATSVAEIGVSLYPTVAGDEATLFRNETVDRQALDQVIAGVREVSAHLTTADEELSQVAGSTPFVGDTLAARRDDAAAELEPLAGTVTGIEPMLDQLPQFFGFEGQRTILVALLNPADQRYSGGATLAFSRLTFRDGRVDVEGSLDLRSNPRLREPIRWRKVFGNYFHYPGQMRLLNATFAPSWSVSGEEVLRGWRAATGEDYESLLAIDLVALADLFEVTGGVTVPGLGELTSDNLVEELVGNYDDYYPNPNVLDEYSARIIPKFKDELFNGGDYVAKAKAFSEAARGRHLAFYSRDPAIQDGVRALGLDGDLTTPQGDYLGVFTQNINASKAEYWQSRRVDLRVALQADGSADNDLTVRIHNDSPPYVQPEPDPRRYWYWTRWAGIALGVFLPDGVEVEQVQAPQEPWGGFVGNAYEHDFFTTKALIAPQERIRLGARYTVPDAATVDDADLTYRLAIDPHGMVRKQPTSVTVTLPDGYQAVALPEGWEAEGDDLTWTTDDLESSVEWEIVAAARD